MALPVSLPDEETVMAAADSWTTCEELAGHVVREKGYYLFFIVYYLFIKIPQARGEGGSYHLPHRGILTVTGKKPKELSVRWHQLVGAKNLNQTTIPTYVHFIPRFFS